MMDRRRHIRRPSSFGQHSHSVRIFAYNDSFSQGLQAQHVQDNQNSSHRAKQTAR